MEIHFKSAHTKDVADEVTPGVIAIAERKIGLLKKYLSKDDATTQVYVELGKATESQQTGMVWQAQINLDSKGKRYHAKARGEHLETAIDATVKELKDELRKAKKKQESMLRKGGGTLKSFIRGFRAR